MKFHVFRDGQPVLMNFESSAQAKVAAKQLLSTNFSTFEVKTDSEITICECSCKIYQRMKWKKLK